MATSRLLENIRVKNPKAVEDFVTAMEASAAEPLVSRTDDRRSGVVTDEDRLRCFMRKALDYRKGQK